jgi:hypothetical protein
MQDEYAFRPDRRMGFVFHLAGIFVLALAGFFGFWQATQASTDRASILYLLPILAVAVFAPVLAYRLFALQSAVYILARDGIRLRWGLRSQDIPIDEILWVHPAGELTAPLPLPPLRVPGAVIGRRRIPGDGEIEYLASNIKNLLMIATPTGGFVISPSEPEQFIQIYQRFTELGSLAPLPWRSVYPSFLLQRVWSTAPARALLLISLLLSFVLLTWVSLAIPALEEVPLGFLPNGSPGDLVPAARLILLPLLNFFFLAVGVILGLFFFRQEESRPVSYVLWSSSALTALLFLAAVFFILQSS